MLKPRLLVPSLLLGNGFSRGFSNDFGYRRLRDVAEMADLSVPKDDLFDHAQTDDFETVMENVLFQGRPAGHLAHQSQQH